MSEDGHNMCVETLVKLWILAQRFLIPKLQNQVMDKLWDVLHSAISLSIRQVVQCIQESRSDVLRNALLDYVAALRPSYFNVWVDALSAEMVKHLAKVLHAGNGKRSTAKTHHVPIES